MLERNLFPSLSLSRVLIVTAAFATSLPFSFPIAVAQQVSGDILEEIVVTVRYREETVKDVPATVYVFTEQAIERSNITRAGEIALLTPGVTLVDAAEVGDTQVNIRGMNGARDAENSYALVIDGITMTNPAALNRDYLNLQQIEVLKGPQGAIYGRNASAGAFVINTKKPGDELDGSVLASVAEDATYGFVGVIDGPITDGLGYTVQADYRRTDGFYNNEYLGRDDVVDNFKTWSVNGRLLWEPSEDLALDTKLRYANVDGSSIAFNSIFHIEDLVVPFGSQFLNENVNDHNFRFYSNIQHFNEQEAVEASIKLDYDMDWATLTTWALYSDIDNKLGADGTSAAFGFFNGEQSCIDTVTALGSGGIGFPLNPPQFIGTDPISAAIDPVNGSFLGAYTPTTCDGTQYQERNQKDISFEARLTSPGDEPFRWSGGLYFLTIDREVGVNTGIDRIDASLGYKFAKPVAALYTAVNHNPTEQLAWDDFDTDVYSVFGSVEYDFTDAFTADFALRYDREERDVKNKVPFGPSFQTLHIDSCELDFSNTGGTPLNPGQCDPNNTGDPANPANHGPIPPKSANFDQWQPKLSLSWDTTEQWTLFGSVGMGFRSGGFNNSGSQATVDTFINTPLGLCDPNVGGQACIDSGRSEVAIKDEYKKETAVAAEIGFKSTLFDNRVNFEGAGYWTEVDDMQFFEFIVGGFGLLRVVENIDEVEIRGVELAATWHATDWFDLFVGGNWIDSEIKKNTTRWDTVGNESPYTPDYTGNLGAYFRFPISPVFDFFTNLDVSTVGKTWFHAVQDERRPITFELLVPNPPLTSGGPYSTAQRDAYTLANIRIGIETEAWTAAFFANNLTDEDWLEEVIPAPEFGGSFSHVGTERRMGADFTWRF